WSAFYQCSPSLSLKRCSSMPAPLPSQIRESNSQVKCCREFEVSADRSIHSFLLFRCISIISACDVMACEVVKYYGWEESFGRRLNEFRSRELDLQRSLNFYNTFFIFFFLLLPLLMTLTAFGTYVALGEPLEVSRMFIALAYFNALQLPMLDLPQSVAQIIMALVASKRLTAFLAQQEVNPA